MTRASLHYSFMACSLYEGGAAVNHSNLPTRHSPLLNDFMIGTVSLQLIKSGLHGSEHRGIALTNDNTFLRCIDDGTTNRELTRMLLIVVVGYRGVLVRGNHATICQQLDYSSLV